MNTVIEWFYFKDKKPDDDLCILVYWEDDQGRIELKSEWIFTGGQLLDTEYEPVDILPEMVWALWPEPTSR